MAKGRATGECAVYEPCKTRSSSGLVSDAFTDQPLRCAVQSRTHASDDNQSAGR